MENKRTGLGRRRGRPLLPDAKRKTAYGVSLSDQEHSTLIRLGAGSLTKGVRRVLRYWREKRKSVR